MRIPIFCSLIPTELLIRLGHEPVFVEASDIISCQQREYACVFHENICTYAKSLFDFLTEKESEFDLIIIPTSCDALKKLYNALAAKIDNAKLYSLYVPQNKGKLASNILEKSFNKLADRLIAGDNYSKSLKPAASPRNHVNFSLNPRIGIVGANTPMQTINTCLEKFNFEPIYLNHCLIKSYSDNNQLDILKDNDLHDYTASFLEKNTCPRTNDDKYKIEIINRIKEDNICGLIVNVPKFCDFHPFEFRHYKNELGDSFPILLIEHELNTTSEGQLMTRIEAFLEKIAKTTFTKSRATANNKYYVGIDSGSHSTKLVCLNSSSKIVAKLITETGTSVKDSSDKLINELSGKFGIQKKDISKIVATGYGRSKIQHAKQSTTEITCHALGANHTLGKAATIIDIGGQDSKAICIDEKGSVKRFVMNDKCAAGTGRFLEAMASKLNVDLAEFARLATKTKKSASISSMCSVFAESEVISLIAEGKSKPEIARGIHKATADRTSSLVRRISGEPPYYITGGVAKNTGLVKELEKSLGEKIYVLNDPQFSGALGAAIIATKD